MGTNRNNARLQQAVHHLKSWSIRQIQSDAPGAPGYRHLAVLASGHSLYFLFGLNQNLTNVDKTNKTLVHLPPYQTRTVHRDWFF